MWDAIEATVDVVFSVAAVVAAIYACVHVARVDAWSEYFAGPAGDGDYAAVGAAETLQRVGEYLIIAGYFQFILSLAVVILVLRRCKAYKSMLVLAIASLLIAFGAAVSSIVLVSIGTARLESYVPDLMKDAIRNTNLTSDLVVNNSTSTEFIGDPTWMGVGVNWNRLQFEAECCGIDGMADYSNDSAAVGFGWKRRVPGALAPLSCCQRLLDSSYPDATATDYPEHCVDHGTDPSDYYSDGCLNVIQSSLTQTRAVVLVLSCFVICLVLASNVIRCVRHCRER